MEEFDSELSTVDENIVVEAESLHIQKNWDKETRGALDPSAMAGIALSGGGVRSASFAFGVMQALAEEPANAVKLKGGKFPSVLQRLQYLSTVSGGGFAGTALMRLLSLTSKNYDLGRAFPFRRQHNSINDAETLIGDIRHKASYLEPGGVDVDKFSALGVVLRTITITVSIYVLVIATIYSFIHLTALDVARDVPFLPININSLFIVALILVLLTVLSWFCFSLLSGVAAGRLVRFPVRSFLERSSGWAVKLAIALAVVGCLGLFEGSIFEKFTSNYYSVASGGLLFSLGSLGAFASQIISLFGGKSDRRIMPAILIWASGLALILFLLLAAREVALLPDNLKWDGAWKYWQWVLALVLVSFIIGRKSNLNYIGLHRFYRDRLLKVFLALPADINSVAATDKFELADFGMTKNGLFQLINTNVVLIKSETSKYRGRGGDSFLLSSLYCGSKATGWIPTAGSQVGEDRANTPAAWFAMAYNRLTAKVGPMTLASAMAISGAALNPGTGADGRGTTRSGMLSFMLALLGIRLGYWQPNPAALMESGKTFHSPNFLVPGFWSGILNIGYTEKSRWLELTDGGHFENIGLYELFRRKMRTIIVADGSTDPDFSMASFASAYERARNDFGVEIEIHEYPANFNDMMPGSAQPHSPIKRHYNLAERGFAIGVIRYRDDKVPGYIFYVNTVLTEDLKSNLYSFKSEHPKFPDEPIADQFFDEQQFDAYCQLGYELTVKMMGYVRDYLELSAALGLAPNAKAKKWEKIREKPYSTPEQLLADRLDDVGMAIKSLSGGKTLSRLAGVLTGKPD